MKQLFRIGATILFVSIVVFGRNVANRIIASCHGHSGSNSQAQHNRELATNRAPLAFPLQQRRLALVQQERELQWLAARIRIRSNALANAGASDTQLTRLRVMEGVSNDVGLGRTQSSVAGAVELDDSIERTNPIFMLASHAGLAELRTVYREKRRELEFKRARFANLVRTQHEALRLTQGQQQLGTITSMVGLDDGRHPMKTHHAVMAEH